MDRIYHAVHRFFIIIPFSFLFLLHAFIDEECHDEYADADKYITYLMAVFRYFGKQLFLVLNAGYCGQVIADKSQDGIPKACTQGGVQQESSQLHACQTGRDGYQLAYGRYQAADKVDTAPCLSKYSSACCTLASSMRHMCPKRLLANL